MKAFYKVKLSDGSEDSLSFPARRNESKQVEVFNGGKWYLAEGSMTPDSITETNGFYTWDSFAGRQVWNEYH